MRPVSEEFKPSSRSARCNDYAASGGALTLLPPTTSNGAGEEWKGKNEAMKAVLFREHGGPDKLSYEEMPMPQIGPQEVLIRVKACALNHLDIWVRQGNPAYPIPLPHVLRI